MTNKKSFTLNKYFSLTKGSIMESLSFRFSMLITVIGNLIYLIVIYYLWKAIYASSSSEVVNGMTFHDTMIYLVLALALFNFMECFIVWSIGRNFQTGQIALELIKPMDYQVFCFFANSGQYLISFFTTFLPTLIIVYLITKGGFALSINLIYFILSVILAIVINFCVDFFVGVICFYTESVWGVNIMKEVVVALLSGASIPLAFFPDRLRTIVNFLPFQAIYNSPLKILIDKSLETKDYITIIGFQIFWVAIMILISRIFWNVSKRIITVNGG
ncbi:ABC-2 type transport system permease protein [Mobilisporobacter senegalensis]|uniref:ABC-2 type transport system permease protein n=1 Tax=Mobilisporobacter senegalensis TaxID=1329262 RepID=A0A3N1XBI7_9FIRM|nr:ABC-2 family transporter protein [Mobilisporobacter senegalensis]ROR22097.1 ABC-2 type transport system permease protein [Mobilisporobacter senegalensis]